MLKEIGQVAAFLICAQTLLHFRAKESYEKYIKLVISMMLLLLLARPFLNFAGGAEEEEIMGVIKKYNEGMQIMLSENQLSVQEMEGVLSSLAEQAVQQEAVQQEAVQQDEAQNKGTYSEKIIIERIEIGEEDGTFE